MNKIEETDKINQIEKIDKNVVLFVNLGSPDQPSKYAVFGFLSNFLRDKRVVALPKILWYPILYYVVLPIRCKALALRYEQIWIDGYSPIFHYAKNQYNKLLERNMDADTIIVPAFSYSTPNISQQLKELHKLFNIKSLKVIPLYPQFSSTTTSAVFDQIAKYYSNKLYLPDSIEFIRGFHNNHVYISAICNNIKKSWQEYGRGQILIFSYHSLPQKLIDKGDNYWVECLETTRLVAQELNLQENEYKISFQSKFGLQKWISPATDNTIKELAQSGVKLLDIVCPGFFSDCLETLEEINDLNRELFLKNGGEKYIYIPCLNDSDEAIDLIMDLVKNRN